MPALKILLADDHELIRKGLRTALESRRGWTICGEAVNGREAIELAHRTLPDIIIMDLTMPELNGLAMGVLAVKTAADPKRDAPAFEADDPAYDLPPNTDFFRQRIAQIFRNLDA